MKILFLLTQLESGGAQTRVAQSVELLRSQGEDVDLAFFYEKRACFDEVQKLILAKRRGGGAMNILGGILALARLVKRNNYDVVVTNTAPANIIGNTIGWLLGLRGRVAYQTQPPARLSTAYRIADLLVGTTGIYKINIVNSEWTRGCFDNHPRRYREKLHLLYDGIVPPPVPDTKMVARRALGIPEDKRLILNVGRLSAQKDQRTLIEAMSAVDGTLYIAGDGELKQELATLAAECAPGKVVFLGELPRDDLGMYLAAADVFAFSSKWETFGLALVEAASYGLPMVVTDLPVSREVLAVNGQGDERSSCTFVVPGDVEAFRNALNTALNDSALGKASTPHLCQTFTIEYHTAELLRLCRLAAA
ncbi:glycosyltransferase family 4 protein [Stenotrophomonas sp. TWI377]|uniref:glycosyltransferase family 4 protein n=1 Tax=Stenotrophomonas sp. TWI377 TaxID=3136775 RepID=UPI00320B11CC